MIFLTYKYNIQVKIIIYSRMCPNIKQILDYKIYSGFLLMYELSMLILYTIL